jgi:hypothetical protein
MNKPTIKANGVLTAFLALQYSQSGSLKRRRPMGRMISPRMWISFSRGGAGRILRGALLA